MGEISVSVSGNVATEPKHVVGSTGKPRTTFRLATTARKRQPDGSFADGATSFLNVACFDTLALNAAASLLKGQPVVITGAMTVREWEMDGRTGREVDLVVRTLGHDLRWGRATFSRPPRDWTPETANDAGAEIAPPAASQVPVGERVG